MSAFAVAAASGTPAIAQDTAADEAVDTSNDIVVTAQRKPELLSKAALSISAVTGNDLKAAGVVDATSLTIAVPTVKIDQANGLQITIRGVSSADGTEKGDPSAAFMLNGVYLARQQSLSGAFFDLDRIEVLRGPQGTLYGRNATAGVVNVLTKRPTDKFEGAINGEIGNYGTYRTDAMLNIPVSDNFSLRAAGAYNKHDSFLVAAPGVTSRLGQDQDEYAARLSAELKFGGEGQGNLLLVGDYAHQGGAGPQGVRLANFYSGFATTRPLYLAPSSAEARTVDYAIVSDPYQDNKIYGVTGELNWDFGPVNLTYLGSYRVFDRDSRSTYISANSGRFAEQYVSGKSAANSQELRLATSGDGPLEAVAGLYYFREHATHMNTVLHDYVGYALYAFLQNPVNSESKAVFGQATYHLTDTLRVTGGVRYSKDLKSRDGVTIFNRTSQVLDPNTYTVASVNDAKRSFSKVTWKAGVEYDVSKSILFYANAATGYKAGGFNDGCRSGSDACTSPVADDALYYKPEELNSYEAGIKGRFLGNAVTFSAAGFYYDYTNMQLSSPGPLGQTTLNAGKAKIKGVETSATITPSSRNRFDISFNYLDAYYTEYRPTAALDFAGKSLDNAPKWVVGAGYTYTAPLGNGGDLSAHVDTRLSDDYVLTNFANGTQFRNPSTTKTNATLTYNAPENRWFVQAFVKNAENTITFSGYGSGRVYVSEPRLYGARAGVRF
ncbi:TonB-dependent receptor [Novosphingobium barchaimii]|uniref:TonB-dependent receptor n=1 Tax=Novosphingobium barchaimii TaxID=1420591 RepID=UPI001F1AB029|nr:TonB-dependent receptor [Novosphingobium barchaimii]